MAVAKTRGVHKKLSFSTVQLVQIDQRWLKDHADSDRITGVFRPNVECKAYPKELK